MTFGFDKKNRPSGALLSNKTQNSTRIVGACCNHDGEDIKKGNMFFFFAVSVCVFTLLPPWRNKVYISLIIIIIRRRRRRRRRRTE